MASFVYNVIMDLQQAEKKYLEELQARAFMPKGFRFGIQKLSFFPEERPVANALPMNLSLVLADKPCSSFALRLTSNQVCGAPILLARERKNNAYVQGILINNKISNVGAPAGLETARKLTSTAAQLLKLDDEALLASSTGIIGWSLPLGAMQEALPGLVASLGSLGPVDMARAIMTTDRYPKLRSIKVGEGSILAIAKGAGMIEPNLATMLVFILTDIAMSREDLDRALGSVIPSSFNAISVDSDQSTSDMCVLLSSSAVPAVDFDTFTKALGTICRDLAVDIVRNGEGTKHVMRVQVEGFGDYAYGLGKAVVNSPLVKTAVYGNDPNVGRILSSIGDYLGNNGIPVDMSRVSVRLWDIPIYSNGAFYLDQTKENILSARFQECSQDPERKGSPEHDKFVDITISRTDGSGSVVIYGSDLGYEYIKENADYRS